MKKLAKIYLHIGSDKTGSTAIQHTLHNNRQKLSELSYIYADGLHHYLLAAYFSQQPLDLDYFRVRIESFDLEKVKSEATQFVSSLSQRIESATEKYLILSYEGFTGLTETEFRELKAYLNRYSDDIEVVYYLRPPLSYAPSAVSERIKFGMPSWEVHPPVTYYRPRLTILANVFGKDKLNLRSFNRKALLNSDVVADFINQVGLEPTSIDAKPEIKTTGSNTALTEEAILIGDEIIRLLDRKGPKGAEFNKHFLSTLEKIDGDKFVLSELQQEIIKRATAHDVAYIRTEFGLDIADDKKRARNSKAPKKMSRHTAHSLAKIIIDNVLPEFEFIKNLKVDDYPDEKVIKKAIGKLSCDQALPLILRAEEQHDIWVTIHNQSTSWWGGMVAPVKASYHWLNDKKKALGFDEHRTLLPAEGIAPGSHLQLKITIELPKQPGDYFLELTLLQEYFNWFENIGFNSAIVPVKVVK